MKTAKNLVSYFYTKVKSLTQSFSEIFPIYTLTNLTYETSKVVYKIKYEKSPFSKSFTISTKKFNLLDDNEPVNMDKIFEALNNTSIDAMQTHEDYINLINKLEEIGSLGTTGAEQ